ncbi:hypothetical protein FH972_023418 [Carpinus fangiana]|uniref:Deacetylase sirtuin-type domain-containing protein n=1 Tax=Carpinus fangiana TaxID=176857 RepID=A0A5N6KV51_9ROSI|nr:hypothetical protein FH972_023418 [Carpinus fangiana]
MLHAARQFQQAARPRLPPPWLYLSCVSRLLPRYHAATAFDTYCSPRPFTSTAAMPSAASPGAYTPPTSSADITSFTHHLAASSRILVLCGAGLSAASGLPTFRGAGGYWRTHSAMELATYDAFTTSPDLVWQFYNYRRHMALRAVPNGAHYALAELARKKGRGCLTITQNVDGLSQRAGHPASRLELLHGGLFDIKCSGFDCGYEQQDVRTDPIVPALEIKDGDGDISSAQIPLREIAERDLPHCPRCKTGLLRPGVVWFGEALPEATLDRVENYMLEGPIDLIIVVGTSATVYPAAGYIEKARARGARVAVFNTEAPERDGGSGLRRGDWFFMGDAGVEMPRAFEGVIGSPESYPREEDSNRGANLRT